MPEETSDAPSGEVTRLLAAIRSGDRRALDDLFPLVYAELHRLARRHRSRASHNAQSATTLVHEVYLKLNASAALRCEDRRHFFSVAARAMRQTVVDCAREMAAGKRGGAALRLSLEDVDLPVNGRAHELIALGEALERLAAIDARLAQIVDLRFFAGLTVEETAELLGSSARTVKRDWRRAKAFLFATLRDAADPATFDPSTGS